MPHDFQAKAGRTAEIGFKGESFFLLAYAVENPMYGQRPWAELHGDVSIFKAAGREVEAGIEAVAVEPARIEDASLVGARGLNPAGGFRTSAAIVSGKENVPESQGRNRTDNVDD